MKWALGATTRPWGAFSFDQACASIAATGYSDVALYANEGRIVLRADSTDEDVRSAAASLTKHGLKGSMLLGGPELGGDAGAAEEAFRRLVDVSAAAGIRYLMNGGTERPDTFDRYFDLMRRVAPYAEKKGVELQLKPHGGIGLTGADLARAVERVGSPAFTICYDPGNIIYYTRGEVRPEPDVHDVAKHVTTCIIKDCVVVDGKPDVWIQPGSGLVDFRSVLGSLADAGFDGPFYIECLGGSELADIDRRSQETHDWLRDLLANL
ncbi:sugar phosphate isomerase/epimerase [Candidatus Poribacteria bacterium]|nr:sugar phosphate isomerase/epimerase [Candidatus Poribacteria bacterium]